MLLQLGLYRLGRPEMCPGRAQMVFLRIQRVRLSSKGRCDSLSSRGGLANYVAADCEDSRAKRITNSTKDFASTLEHERKWGGTMTKLKRGVIRIGMRLTKAGWKIPAQTKPGSR